MAAQQRGIVGLQSESVSYCGTGWDELEPRDLHKNIKSAAALGHYHEFEPGLAHELAIAVFGQFLADVFVGSLRKSLAKVIEVEETLATGVKVLEKGMDVFVDKVRQFEVTFPALFVT